MKWEEMQWKYLWIFFQNASINCEFAANGDVLGPKGPIPGEGPQTGQIFRSLFEELDFQSCLVITNTAGLNCVYLGYGFDLLEF